MVRVNVVRVVVVGTLAPAIGLHLATMPLLYLALVLGVGETLHDTAAQSIVPWVVNRDELSLANARLQAMEFVMNQLVGPPLGGLLAAAALAAAFSTSAGAYLVAALFLTWIVGSPRCCCTWRSARGWRKSPAGRGYALPELPSKYTAERASWILGILGGLWHIPANLFPPFLRGELTPALVIPILAGLTFGIVGWTIVLSWIYNNTKSGTCQAQ